MAIVTNINLLLTECEVRTKVTDPSFFRSYGLSAWTIEKTWSSNLQIEQ